MARSPGLCLRLRTSTESMLVSSSSIADSCATVQMIRALMMKFFVFTSCLPFPELLRRARLRYLNMLVQCGSAVEWGLLSLDEDWIALLQDDLRWMWQQLWNSTKLRDPQSNFAQWLYIMQYHSSYWRRLVSRAFRHDTLQRRNRVLVVRLHQQVSFSCASAGWTHWCRRAGLPGLSRTAEPLWVHGSVERGAVPEEAKELIFFAAMDELILFGVCSKTPGPPAAAKNFTPARRCSFT